MQSNEGFPDRTDLLTRKVNEFEGQHRFGGGNDADCDPHAMDILAGKGEGDAGRGRGAVRRCSSTSAAPDGSRQARRTLVKMVRK